MRTNYPIKGLLRFYFYTQSGNIAGIALLCLALAAAALITGNFFIYNGFFMVSVAGLPYIIIMGMGGKEYPKWERFRITMPIKRGDLASAQYLCILLASLAGLPLAVLVAILTFNIHEIDYNLTTALLNILSVLATPLLFAGLVFPLGNTKFAENKQEIFIFLCLAVTVGVNMVLIPRIGNRFNLVDGITSLIAFAVALIVFTGGYYIQRNLYTKMDF